LLFPLQKTKLSLADTPIKAILDTLMSNKKNLSSNVYANIFFNKESRKRLSTWSSFLSHIKKEMPLVNQIIKRYFCQKLICFKPSLKALKLSNTSHILSEELLCLLCYSNYFVSTANKLCLIYSSAHHAFSFEKLADALLSYEGPTLILLVHNETTENTPETKTKECPYIFGGFVKFAWKNSDSYQGSDDSYIFSLIPRFQSLYALKDIDSDRSYNYLNRSKLGGRENGIGKVKITISHSLIIET
jgi:hypothetical protein